LAATLGPPGKLAESLDAWWPGSLLLFVIGYIVFQRQEVRG
jgi:hypothetical protein